jgi:heparan-alpha-glucosaminide N-acetyltransferase
MKRIASIDSFRGLTMFLMIWVNDFGSLNNIPKWLKHALNNEDYLGFSDLIFPWFLFAMGLSIPFSIKNRLNKNESNFQIIRHITFRSIALIIMGLFHINMDVYNHEESIIQKPIFIILSTVSFFMVWIDYSRYKSKGDLYKKIFPIVGMVILLMLLFIYVGKDYNNYPIRFGIHWWGILGLIGWVYLIVAFGYLIFRGSMYYLVIAFILSFGINVIKLNGLSIGIFSSIPAIGLQAFTYGGAIVSLILMNNKNSSKVLSLKIILFLGIVSFILGIIFHKFFIISKIGGTPTWVLLSLSSAFIFYAFIFWLVDICGRIGWYAIINVAGSATLTCYLVPYFYYSFLQIFEIQFPVFFVTGYFGLLKSIIYSFIIIFFTKLMVKNKIQIKV